MTLPSCLYIHKFSNPIDDPVQRHYIITLFVPVKESGYNVLVGLCFGNSENMQTVYDVCKLMYCAVVQM